MLTASSSHTFAIEPPSSGLKDENISFGWADFPLIGDGDDRTSHSVPLSPASTNSTIEFTESSPETKEEEFSVLSPAFLKQDSDLTCPTMIESSDSDFDEDEGSLFSSTDDAEGAIVVDNTSAGVRFSSVCVREYNLTVGDHPLTDVFPLALDWDFVEGESIPIDIFEAKAKQRKCSWTRHKASRLALYQRTYRLQVVSGLSYADILELEQARLERQRQDCESESPSCTADAFRAQLPKSQSLTNLRESLARVGLEMI
jgi:hypothetical protein